MSSMYDILSKKADKWTKNQLKEAFLLLIYRTPFKQLEEIFGKKIKTKNTLIETKTKNRIKKIIEEIEKHKAIIAEERGNLCKIEEELSAYLKQN